MTLTRRKFLKTSVVSAGFAFASAHIAFAQTIDGKKPVRRSTDVSLTAQMDPVFSFVPATFQPYVGSFFQAPNEFGDLVALQLKHVKTFKPTRRALRLTNEIGDCESFSLLFEAEAQLPRFNSIHQMSHPALGKFNLFLTHRIGENGELFYEAVISHIR